MYRPPFYSEASAVDGYQLEFRPRESINSASSSRSTSAASFLDAAAELSTTSPRRGLVSPPKKKKQRKRANYLQHTERCCIIRRVAGGEPQAALAREFGVTRAAVCQMYKNREEILAREDSEGEGEMEPQPPTIESRSKTVALLLTTLKDKRTSAGAFRRSAARLTFILIEEAIATYDAHGGLATLAGNNREQDIRFCGIAVGEESSSFTTALRQLDQDAPTGQIHVKKDPEDESTGWRLLFLDVPADIVDCEVLLFSSCGNGGAECKAVEALRSIGVQEHNISLIMVICSSFGYEQIVNRFPNIRIIPAAIDDKWTMIEGKNSEQFNATRIT